jgi:hypothetical protein
MVKRVLLLVLLGCVGWVLMINFICKSFLRGRGIIFLWGEGCFEIHWSWRGVERGGLIG